MAGEVEMKAAMLEGKNREIESLRKERDDLLKKLEVYVSEETSYLCVLYPYCVICACVDIKCYCVCGSGMGTALIVSCR